MPKFAHIKAHSIRDRLYKIIWRAPRRDKTVPEDHTCFGECDWDKRTLRVFPSKEGLELLDTVLEEVTHASFFDLEDTAVREFVRDFRSLCVRMGIEISFTGKRGTDEAIKV